uniref:CUB and zona pellucida-like domains 1, tandem duplicate 1 n=1 Tax=Electrophorus electricus TaxID=8005 RepID=A0A4W4FI35_ELEEL
MCRMCYFVLGVVGSCGGYFTQWSGEFASPQYPSNYPNYAHCSWRIQSPGTKIISLTFTFKEQLVEGSPPCRHDAIQVYDGPSTSYPLLGKLCGSQLKEFRSSRNQLTVVFSSDSSVSGRGFRAHCSLPSNLGKISHVNCSSGNMTIVIQRSYLSSLGFSWQDLYLDDHHCMPSSVGYDVSFSFPLNMCGTNKEISNGHVVYTNNVRAAHSQSGEITRQTQYFLLHVSCHMERDTTVGNLYQAQEVANSTITGVGRFNATMRFYLSSSFSYPVLESPYVVQLNQYVYVQVQLTRQDSSLDVFLDSCVASPNHDFQTRNYDLLRNGCVRDRTVYVYTNGLRPYARFRFQAFKFLRTHAYVFLRCKVVVCANNDYNSRCRRGCQYRRKRAIDSVLHTRAVTLGPITLQGQRSNF